MTGEDGVEARRRGGRDGVGVRRQRLDDLAEGACVAASFRKPSVEISAGSVYWSRGSVSFGNRSRIVLVYSAVSDERAAPVRQ